MSRFEVKYSPIKDGKRKIPQYFVYDTESGQGIVGYRDEKSAQEAVDRANRLIEQSEA